MVICLNVDALVCTDYLDYVTTEDTIAYTESPTQYNIKKGTEFKMCIQPGSEPLINFNDGKKASGIKEGTYKLKEPFNIEKAHTIDKTGIIYENTNVYSDPSAITIVGTIPKDLKIHLIYYYGPFYYFEDSSISGWVYLEYIHFNDNDTIEQDNDMIDNTNTIDQNNNIVDNNTTIDDNDISYNIYIVIFSFVVVFILIVSIIINIIRKKRKKNEMEL